jgi:uncharacterized phiE125 gp8 family phage protein
MALVLITPPTTEPVTLTEAKLQLRVTINDDDNLITALIAQAREYCEGFQCKAYITQTWQLWLDGWPAESEIAIPKQPLQSITSVKYYGTDNTEYTLLSADYFVDAKSQPGRAVLAYGKSWPTITLRPANAICIEFKAGYGDTAANVPKIVKQAILMHIDLLYPGNDYKQEERKAFENARDVLLWQERAVPV